MRVRLRVLNLIVICLLSFAAPLCGQVTNPPSGSSPSQATVPAFVCAKEKDPFASFCTDVNNFLAKAAASKSVNNGKVDRADRNVAAALAPFLNLTSDPTRFTSLQTQVALQSALSTISSGENHGRPDQQMGAENNTSGTTSLVQKVGTPAIMAFALESGTLTQSVSGNSATLNANADGLFRALTGQQSLCFDCPNALGTPVLRNISISAAFTINQQSVSTVDTSGAANPSTPNSVTSVVIPTSAGRLSNLTARYQFWNRFDPRSKDFKVSWDTAVTDAKSQIDDKAKALSASLQELLVQNPVVSDLDALMAVYQPLFYEDADTGNLPALANIFWTCTQQPLTSGRSTILSSIRRLPTSTSRFPNTRLFGSNCWSRRRENQCSRSSMPSIVSPASQKRTTSVSSSGMRPSRLLGCFP